MIIESIKHHWSSLASLVPSFLHHIITLKISRIKPPVVSVFLASFPLGDGEKWLPGNQESSPPNYGVNASTGGLLASTMVQWSNWLATLCDQMGLSSSWCLIAPATIKQLGNQKLLVANEWGNHHRTPDCRWWLTTNNHLNHETLPQDW